VGRGEEAAEHVERAGRGLAGDRLLSRRCRLSAVDGSDPIGQSESLYRTVAAEIEGLVMRLILELRAT